MESSRLQLTVTGLLGAVACVALNLWLFRLGALWGIVGLNVTKHVLIATLCQSLGIDRSASSPPPAAPAETSGRTVVGSTPLAGS